MPANTFPRDIAWKPKSVEQMSLPTGRRTITKSGKVQTRAGKTVGWTWREVYPPLFAGKQNVEEFMAWVDWAWNNGEEFSIQHLLTPGMGKAPNGTGTAGVTVDGSSQSGNAINVTGFPLSTSDVLVAGDMVSISGIQKVFKVTETVSSDGSGNAVLNITPSIFVGEEPASGAAVTLTDVTMNAIIMDIQRTSISNAFYYDGMSITFREAP